MYKKLGIKNFYIKNVFFNNPLKKDLTLYTNQASLFLIFSIPTNKIHAKHLRVCFFIAKLQAFGLKFIKTINLYETILTKVGQLTTRKGRQIDIFLNTFSANPRKWSNTLKQFARNSRQIVLSVLHHFVGLRLKKLSLRPNPYSAFLHH